MVWLEEIRAKVEAGELGERWAEDVRRLMAEVETLRQVLGDAARVLQALRRTATTWGRLTQLEERVIEVLYDDEPTVSMRAPYQRT
jgi:hypothetical protein